MLFLVTLHVSVRMQKELTWLSVLPHRSFKMNSTLCVQPEVYTSSPCVLTKCKSLEDLWRDGRHACEAVKALAKKFVMTVTSREAYDEKTLTCLESLSLKLSFNWIRLDSQLRCFKDLLGSALDSLVQTR